MEVYSDYLFDVNKKVSPILLNSLIYYKLLICYVNKPRFSVQWAMNKTPFVTYRNGKNQ